MCRLEVCVTYTTTTTTTNATTTTTTTTYTTNNNDNYFYDNLIISQHNHVQLFVVYFLICYYFYMMLKTINEITLFVSLILNHIVLLFLKQIETSVFWEVPYKLSNYYYCCCYYYLLRAVTLTFGCRPFPFRPKTRVEMDEISHIVSYLESFNLKIKLSGNPCPSLSAVNLTPAPLFPPQASSPPVNSPPTSLTAQLFCCSHTHTHSHTLTHTHTHTHSAAAAADTHTALDSPPYSSLYLYCSHFFVGLCAFCVSCWMWGIPCVRRFGHFSSFFGSFLFILFVWRWWGVSVCVSECVSVCEWVCVSFLWLRRREGSKHVEERGGGEQAHRRHIQGGWEDNRCEDRHTCVLRWTWSLLSFNFVTVRDLCLLRTLWKLLDKELAQFILVDIWVSIKQGIQSGIIIYSLF